MENQGRCTRHQSAKLVGIDPKLLYGNKRYMFEDIEDAKIKRKSRKSDVRKSVVDKSSQESDVVSEDDISDVNTNMSMEDLKLMMNIILTIVDDILNKLVVGNKIKDEVIIDDSKKANYYTRASSLKHDANVNNSNVNIDGICIDLNGLYKLCNNVLNYDNNNTLYFFMEYISIRTEYYYRNRENLINLMNYLHHKNMVQKNLMGELIKFYTYAILVHLTNLRNSIPFDIKKIGVLNFKYWKELNNNENLTFNDFKQLLNKYKLTNYIPKQLYTKKYQPGRTN